MIKIFKILVWAVVGLLPAVVLGQAEEQIVSYHSNIEVFEDASMQVTETIEVVSTGEQIRRGIYRDFPIAYKDRLGQRYLVSFELLEVTRDGNSEPYHIDREGNGLRVYIGQEDVMLAPGQHTYAITYRTDRQLGFFRDHDELYWNVTGNGWVFPIGQASATVTLPPGVARENISAALFTGSEGSTAKEGSWNITSNGLVEFTTTQALGPYEGLTIVVGWPKGAVTPPTGAENFAALLRANIDYIIGTAGLLLVLLYYLRAWHKRGRDPKKGTVIPQYEPPRGFSPAMQRLISRMDSDDRSFASAIVNMGVKGALSITEEKGTFGTRTYTLTKKAAGKDLSLEEQILADELFSDGKEFKLEKSNATKIVKIRSSFFGSLKKQAGKKYFAKNTGALAIGIVLSVLTVVATIVSTVMVKYSVDSVFQIVFWIGLVVALLAANILFGWLLRAYTPEGRKVADEIEGFKLFLSVTEKDRLAFHNPPEKTPELFEKMLPYALALGVEHKWAEQFADVFARMQEQGTSYAPVWFYGSLAHFNATSFASDMGNTFTGAVASAAVPPGSSSGFSGGSGGGGGGGGGGGW